MINFFKFFLLNKYKILGSQNVISFNKKILFNNSGFSSIKNIIFKNIKISTYQYCIRMQGIYNDFLLNNDGIHFTSFLMIGNFKKNPFFFKKIFYSIKYIFFFLKLKKNEIFFSINLKNLNFLFLIKCSKINNKNILLTKKNIWRINNNGIIGFCIEIFLKINNKLLEIWNIVNINYIKYFLKIYKIKLNLLDTGLGYDRIKYIKKKKINLKIFDFIKTLFIIVNYKIIKKYHIFILNKLIRKILIFIYKKKIKMFNIIYFFFKKNIFFFNYKILFFLLYMIKKEFFFYKKKIKININKLNIFYIKNIFFTKGIFYYFIYNNLKKFYDNNTKIWRNISRFKTKNKIFEKYYKKI